MKRADAKEIYEKRRPTHMLEEDPVVVSSEHRVRHKNHWTWMACCIHADGTTCNVLSMNLRRIKK